MLFLSEAGCVPWMFYWQNKLDTNHGSKDEKRHVLEFVTQIHQLLPEHTEI